MSSLYNDPNTHLCHFEREGNIQACSCGLKNTTASPLHVAVQEAYRDTHGISRDLLRVKATVPRFVIFASVVRVPSHVMEGVALFFIHVRTLLDITAAGTVTTAPPKYFLHLSSYLLPSPSLVFLVFLSDLSYGFCWIWSFVKDEIPSLPPRFVSRYLTVFGRRQ